MKKTLMVLATILLASAAFAADSDSAPNFDEPPFWMPSFGEVTDWRDEQRAYFVDLFAKDVRALPPLALLKKTEIESATDSVDEWKALMTQVYRACAEDKNLETCEKLADHRVKALDRGAVRAGEGSIYDEIPGEEDLGPKKAAKRAPEQKKSNK